jgi:Mrp family chromosome partitioning ATPase
MAYAHVGHDCQIGDGVMMVNNATLAGQADFVIVDSPPVLGMADAVALAPLADGVLLVVDARMATERVLARARKQFGLLDTEVLGAVVVGRRALMMNSRFLSVRRAARRVAA